MGPKVGDTLKFEEFYGDDDQAWWQVYPAFTPTVCVNSGEIQILADEILTKVL
jgi:hypothetical protein